MARALSNEEGLMLQTTERKPIVSESTPEAADFTDRLGNLRYDVRMIELGVEALRQHYNGGGNDIEAIIMACRRLEADVDMLADEILPPHSEEENERVAEILRESANDKHTAELRRIERVTGVKLAAAEVVAMEADRTMSC
jgi:hypothetical protein